MIDCVSETGDLLNAVSSSSAQSRRYPFSVGELAEAVDTHKTMEMANNNKHTDQKSTEEVNFERRRSFSWDRAFFTSDGFLAAEELSSMIEAGAGGFQHESQRIQELESLEVTLFQETEPSKQKSTGTSNVTDLSIKLSSGKKDFQAKKVAGGAHKASPIKKTASARSSPISCASPENNVKTQGRRSSGSKTGKGNADSPSKTPPRIITKSKVASISTGKARTSPASPVSPGSSGSSSSTFAANQRSKRSGSAPCGSSVSKEKLSVRRNDELKLSKPAVVLTPKTQSSISMKVKPPPLLSRSPTQQPSESPSPSTSRSKSRSTKGSPVHHMSKPTSRNSPSGQTSVPSAKQPVTACKTATPKKQLSSKAKPSGGSSGCTENLLAISPEILDLKGKINALRMEISIQKERYNKMVGAGSV